MKSALSRVGKQTLRVVILLAVVVASGIGLGLAAGYPVSRVELNQNDSVRLEQSTLAGEVDPALALVTSTDLELGWEAGDPAMAGFGLLGSDFCGREIPVPTALSEMQSAVFVNPADESLLISQAIRVDRWQSARDYVDELADAMGECERFYRPSADGGRMEVTIMDGVANPPITDHVSRTFRAVDGSSTQTWSVMSVGDVIIATFYSGSDRPRQGLIGSLEQEILMRVDPKDFAPGGVPVTTSPTSTVAPGGGGDTPAAPTTVVEGGAADESETPG